MAWIALLSLSKPWSNALLPLATDRHQQIFIHPHHTILSKQKNKQDLPFIKNGCPIQEFSLLEPSWLGSNLNYYDQHVSPNCHTIFKKNTEVLFFFKVRCSKFQLCSLLLNCGWSVIIKLNQRSGWHLKTNIGFKNWKGHNWVENDHRH